MLQFTDAHRRAPTRTDAHRRAPTRTDDAALAIFRIVMIMKPRSAHGPQKPGAGWGVLVDDPFAGAGAEAQLQPLSWPFV